MLIKSNVSKGLWTEAINTTVFLRNRCPSKSNNGIIPYELWSNRKPNVKFFRIFGFQVTFLKKREKVIFIGYSGESKTYRLQIPSTRKVIKSRDVRFIEKVNENKIETVDIVIIKHKY